MFNRCGVKAVNLGAWYPTSQESELKTEEMFCKTGLLSVLTTSHPAVRKEYFNLDDATKECLEENNIPGNIVPASAWRVPVYAIKPLRILTPLCEGFREITGLVEVFRSKVHANS